MKRIKIWAIPAAILLLMLPFVVQMFDNADFLLRIAVMIGIYIILTLSLNIIVGYAGQFALGHAAFYGIGAYTAALLMVNYDVSFWLALPAAAIVTGFFGFLLGTPVMRLKGDYLGIVTLGFGEIVRLIFVNWIDLTNGPMGIPGIPAPSLGSYTLGSNMDFYYLVLVVTVISVLIIRRIVQSGFGLNLLTVREDEIAAESIGIRPMKYKLLAFTIGALFAGVAGALFAVTAMFVSPDSFQYVESVNILAMVVLGGTASIPGSILGATILTVAPEALRFISDYRLILLGLIIVLMMVYKPSGFWGESKRKRNFFGMTGR
ncbi:branched-chain amino acid ABC transporter permease [Paenibacillus abyssi]|uniref:Branched-chain amino acid ABC transporter permease n=1 Tax=Paenibacillus abyssi TaxID=1340531 RepID=A0A917FRY4_9BACL|nr:branched-chain amino acid ABC transporter permease [Paenibacillus abyssi]GGF97438.1 branched-chain amino acid ABC transporter permease [Paenibacillus abyssi]